MKKYLKKKNETEILKILGLFEYIITLKIWQEKT